MRCRAMCGPLSFISTGRNAACLVARPAMRLRHMRNDEAFISRRIRAITADSFSPNCVSIASKVVRSSHAISIMREISAGVNSVIGSLCFILKRLQQSAKKSPPAAAKHNWRAKTLQTNLTFRSPIQRVFSVFHAPSSYGLPKLGGASSGSSAGVMFMFTPLTSSTLTSPRP